MTNQQRFEAACLAHRLGPRLDIENYPDVPAFPVYERTRRIALELISSAHAHVPSLPPIHFDFVDVPQVNAWAFKHDGHYFIAFTAGAVCMLHLVLDRILANPNTFQSVGDSKAELTNIQPVDWNIVDPEQLFDLGIRPVVAQDEVRQRYAKHLADQALMFLVGHEIAHITRGHVDFLNATQCSYLAEVGWRGETNQKRLERQAIEADADQRSVYARCYSLFQTARDNAGRTPQWACEPVTVTSLQFDWAFAVNVLFRLFGDHGFVNTDLASESYPPLALRRRVAMDCGCRVLLENWGTEHREEIFDAIAGSIRVTELSFLAIGAASTRGGFDEAYSDVGSQHMGRIAACWKDLKAQLVPYAYESLDATV